MSMQLVSKKLGITRFGLSCLVGASAVMAAVISFSSGAVAQETTAPTTATQESTLPSIAEEFEDTFFTFDENFFRNRRFPRNLTWIFGPYPENEIAGDGRVTNRLYNELLKQQTQSDPTIRTADLPNPYDSSLLTGTLYTEEPVPPAPASIFRQSNPAPAETAPAETREAPVPALW